MAKRALMISPDPVAALEQDVEAAIEACGGDPWAAVRVLLVSNAYLESENEVLQQALSSKFAAWGDQREG